MKIATLSFATLLAESGVLGASPSWAQDAPQTLKVKKVPSNKSHSRSLSSFVMPYTPSPEEEAHRKALAA
jgi:hypothetical protein